MLVAALAVGAAGGCGATVTVPGARIGVAYDFSGPGSPALDNLVRAGLAKVQRQLGGRIAAVRSLTARAGETEADKYDRLIILCGSGYSPVLAVGTGYAGADPATGPLARAAAHCPKTRFALVDDGSVAAPNVADLVFAQAQGAFLVGAAAGLATGTGKVGFVGGCPLPVVVAALAGYRAGVAAAHPHATVLTRYLATDPANCRTGFTDELAARAATDALFAAGVDVVYQFAGRAGDGVLAAAKSHGGLAVGNYADQYQQAGPDLRPALLTSMLVHAETAVPDFVRAALAGRFVAGPTNLDLAAGGVGYSTSGSAITPYLTQLDGYRKRIISGDIVVPNSP